MKDSNPQYRIRSAACCPLHQWSIVQLRSCTTYLAFVPHIWEWVWPAGSTVFVTYLPSGAIYEIRTRDSTLARSRVATTPILHIYGAACGNRTHDKRLEISCVTSTLMPHNKGVNAFTLYYHNLLLFYLDIS